MRSFKIDVYGCQMNAYDGDRLRTALSGAGWTEVQGEDEADAVLFVTCSIRDKAEQKVASELGRYRPGGGRKAPVVALLGCMAQRLGEDIPRRFPWVRLLAGPRHLGRVPEALGRCLEDDQLRVFLDEDPRALEDLRFPPQVTPGSIRAYVTIAHGCDHFCAYCIVPYVRGRFQSRDPEAILREVRCLADRGVREITLLGQNVNRFGVDRSDGFSFPRLLREVAEVPGVLRVRYATSHPVDFSEELVRVMAEHPRVCPALNLPVQSGSDRILAAMGRGYDGASYRRSVGLLRERVPDAGLTTDLIVGFPGETEEDFRESLSLLEELRFDQVHSAAYSVRPGTRAEGLPGHLDQVTRMRRLGEVNDLQSRIAREINETYVGRVLPVLAEGAAPKGEGLWQGRTPQDKVVLFPGPATAGEEILVRIVSAETWYLRGEMQRPGEGRPWIS
ncbi:tRNA (N6-isopentenyl adenosine(37)-C2)-methylthiotransferase MiaB [Aminomonas paucivorans]|uniref:tRNA (N6-isopentenyl adenosine(37)-C2)-methylthiotransferase MiaB n=1 Tax=Aminomonas paucivorans TaxID=81412 RepID=UPI0033207AEA